MDTPISLLERLRKKPDEKSWQQFDALYRPLILRWLQRDPALRDDAEDLTQDILYSVFRKLADFKHQKRNGSFRAWLRMIMLNRVRDHLGKRQKRPQPLGLDMAEGPLAQLADDHSDLSQLWEKEHHEHVFKQLLKLIASEFNAVHYRAFYRYVIQGASPAEVAQELGVSVAVVLNVKSRILHRLRQLGDGLLD